MNKYATLLLICTLFSCSPKENKKAIHWQESIGVLEVGGRTHWIHYEVNGEHYKSTFYWRNYGAINGEKYTIRYNTLNPKEIEIDYWHPLFEPGEPIIKVKGRVSWVAFNNMISDRKNVVFVVDAPQFNFKREQTLPPNAKKLFPNLKRGQYYEVECDSSNPRRAIIKLNIPIDDQ